MENTELEIINIEEITPEVIYQQDKATIDVQIATAQKFPRNIKRATDDAIAVVLLSPEVAAQCIYSVPRGGKAITGASVHLAKIIAQSWGNMRMEAKVVGHDSKYVTSQGIAFDLQKNIAIKVEVKRSILQNEYKDGKKTGRSIRMNDDMITVTGNAANSIALRNAILSIIPKGVVDTVYNAAKQVITGDISDNAKLLRKRTQVFNGLRDTYGLTEEEILKAVGKAAIDHITADDIVVLIGTGQAIKDGDTTVDLAFRGGKSANPEAKQSIDKQAENKQRDRFLLSLKEITTLPDLDMFVMQCEGLGIEAEIEAKRQELTADANKKTKK